MDSASSEWRRAPTQNQGGSWASADGSGTPATKSRYSEHPAACSEVSALTARYRCFEVAECGISAAASDSHEVATHSSAPTRRRTPYISSTDLPSPSFFNDLTS